MPCAPLALLGLALPPVLALLTLILRIALRSLALLGLALALILALLILRVAMLSLALLSLAPAHVLALLVLTWTLVLITLALRGLTGRALPGRLVFLGLLASTGAFRLPVVRRILRRGEAYSRQQSCRQ